MILTNLFGIIVVIIIIIAAIVFMIGITRPDTAQTSLKTALAVGSIMVIGTAVALYSLNKAMPLIIKKTAMTKERLARLNNEEINLKKWKKDNDIYRHPELTEIYMTAAAYNKHVNNVEYNKQIINLNENWIDNNGVYEKYLDNQETRATTDDHKVFISQDDMIRLRNILNT